MKSVYNKTLTYSEAKNVALKFAQEKIERFNRTELPVIRENYAKMFVFILNREFGFGDKRVRRALKALSDLTCEMDGFIKDGIYQEVYDKRLKRCRLWNAFQDFAHGEVVPISPGSPYFKPKEEE